MSGRGFVPESRSGESEELFEHFRFHVDAGQSLLRIDKYLMNRIENASRNRLQNAANSGAILVNEKAVKPSYKVKPGDVISIVLPEPVKYTELIAEDIPLEIVFEDESFIIINKKPGMVVHPAHGNYSGTLMNALLFHFNSIRKKQNALLEVPGLVHRIDKNTSGLMVIAKTELAEAALAKEFFARTIERKYIALVWGDFVDDSGTITGNIGRHKKNRLLMDVFDDEEHGKPAVTHYKVLERFGYVTLVECKLETGRTHQIRVHMKHIGHPLFNDEAYGGERILKGTTFTKYKQFIANCFELLPRQALHAKTLGFIHPSTKKKVFFDSELPDDMRMVIEKWRKYVLNRKD
ncbi:MAG: RluA family pseudouridine synthase [Bacteroidia bacterium]|nr:RluA family pseudouridine synthase [Bacteroidia bacterium]